MEGEQTDKQEAASALRLTAVDIHTDGSFMSPRLFSQFESNIKRCEELDA